MICEGHLQYVDGTVFQQLLGSMQTHNEQAIRSDFFMATETASDLCAAVPADSNASLWAREMLEWACRRLIVAQSRQQRSS